MVYTDKHLKTALLAVADENIAAFDAAPAVTHERSREYLDALEAIAAGLGQHSRLSFRRIAVIIVAAIITALTVTACCVHREKIAEKFNEWFKIELEEHETYAEVLPAETPTPLKKIETYYEPTWVPDRFTLYEQTPSESLSSMVWGCDTGMIIFEQGLVDSTSISINTENAERKEIVVDNKLVSYFYAAETHSAFWRDDYYIYGLTFMGEATYEELLEIISSIEIISST